MVLLGIGILVASFTFLVYRYSAERWNAMLRSVLGRIITLSEPRRPGDEPHPKLGLHTSQKVPPPLMTDTLNRDDSSSITKLSTLQTDLEARARHQPRPITKREEDERSLMDGSSDVSLRARLGSGATLGKVVTRVEMPSANMNGGGEDPQIYSCHLLLVRPFFDLCPN